MIGLGAVQMKFPLCLKSVTMRLNPRILSSAAAIALACIVSAAAYYFKSRKSEVNEVMTFCKLQFNVFNYFDKLLSFIEAANESVNVCMPSIHNPAIQGRLVELIKRKKIKARIVIDGTGFNSSTEFFLKELSDVGAEIKWKVSEHRMQHKFCLIDDAVLMIGTLDWGNDLTSDNWNYVYITTKPQLVEPVKKEFYSLWNECHIGLREALDMRQAAVDEEPPVETNVKSDDVEENQGNLEDNYEVLENVPPNEGNVDGISQVGIPSINTEGTAMTNG